MAFSRLRKQRNKEFEREERSKMKAAKRELKRVKSLNPGKDKG